jgi:hypothetical protein
MPLPKNAKAALIQTFVLNLGSSTLTSSQQENINRKAPQRKF